MEEDEIKEYKVVIDITSNYYTAMEMSKIVEELCSDINIDGCTSCVVSTVEERAYTRLVVK